MVRGGLTMRKSLLAALFSFLLSAFLIEVARAQPLTSLSEGFDDVTTLPGAGWVITNNSSPLGNHNWAQGIPPPGLDTLGANAQSGAPNSFIQTDFNAGLPGSGAIVSDWLITPVLLLENGATMSFYTQASPSQYDVSERTSGLGEPERLGHRERGFNRSEPRGRFHN